LAAKEKLYRKNNMQNLEEIKAFAEAEGFEVRTCGHFARSLVPLVKNCELCGDTGFYFLAQETAWPPAALTMMMADRARREEIAAAAKAASVALAAARSPIRADKACFSQFEEREKGLNEVNQQLMKIWTAAQGAQIE
jgi:hypothetical protein